MFILKNNIHQDFCSGFDERKTTASSDCWLLQEHSASVPLVTVLLLEMALILASLELSSFHISFVFFFFEKDDYCKCPLVYVSY